MSERSFNHSRSRARRLAAQAMYQCMVADAPVGEVVAEFMEERNTGRADRDYFRELVTGAVTHRAALESVMDPLLDRPLAQLDPVEHAILLLATFELRERLENPFRVVIDEAVETARMFGAEDSYKFINAVLDRCVKILRPGGA